MVTRSEYGTDLSSITFQGPRFERFVFDVEMCECASRVGEGVEVGREWDAREFAFEVGGVAFTVFRVVEDGVDVMEDGFFGDGVVGVTLAELVKRGVFEV